ncbi:hypothetical protein ABPG74_002863 [Tetrahymena malaccensis]
MLIKYFFAILIISLPVKFVYSVVSSSYDFIFQQLQFPPHLLGKQSQVTSMTSNKDYTVVAFQRDGIKWIDNHKCQPVDSAAVSLNGTTISALAISSDSRFLFTSSDNRLTMYSVSTDNKFALTQIKQSTEKYGVITNIYLIQDEKIAIILGDQGAIIAYDIQSKLEQDQMKIFTSYFAKSKNIMGFARITDNLKWIFVADLDKGVYVLKLTIELDLSLIVKNVIIIQAAWAYARYCNQVEVIKDLSYLIILESWRGFRIAPLANLHEADPSEYPITLPQNDIWWFNLLYQPIFYGSYISNDSKYLVTAIRSQGIMIFDINNPLNPKLYYQIKKSGCPTKIEMVSTQDLLFYTDGISLLLFKRVEPNMNDQFPNLFNSHQSKLFSYSTSFAQWRCYVSEDQNFIINAQCGDIDFLQMKNGDPYNISLFKRINAIQNTRTCTMAFLSNGRYMYRPVRENNYFMYIYDILSISNYANSDFPIVGNVTDANPPRGEDLVFSKDETILIVNYGQGVVIYDSQNKFDLIALSYWFIPAELNGWPSSIVISDDNQYCIVASRTIGTFFLLDISDLMKPNLVNQLYTNGAELLLKSTIYKNISYVCDGTSGFAILDFSALPQFKFISRIPVDGWVNHMTLIQNEQYAILSSMDYNGMISLIDLRDLYNPVIISKYVESNEQSIANCVLQSLEYGFSTSNKGLRIFPLKSEIAIHSSFYLIQANSQVQAISNNLQIGQKVLIQLLPLYAVDGMQILDVFYYNNFQNNDTPSWIEFIKDDYSIKILVDKQASSSSSSPTQNILIIQTALPFSGSSFVYDEIPTNLTDGQLIFNFLKEQGTITKNNLVSTTFDPNSIPISLSYLNLPQTTRLVELITLTLQRGIFYNPIVFYVSSSLHFQPENEQIITSPSSEVKVQMTIEQSQAGTFVEKQYSGVIVSISENGQSILIYGTLDAVNKILKQKIFYFLNPLIPKEILDSLKVSLIIIDGLNENLILSQQYTDASKYYLQQKSYIKQVSSLQSQINEQFDGSEMTVIEQNTINIQFNTFQNSDNFLITYNVYLQSNQQGQDFIILPIDYWLKFQPTSLQFSGIAPIFLLNTKVTIKMVASDGYSETSDVFTIKLTKLPFTYVFNLLVQILTPLISIVQIYKYRYLIVNIFCQKQAISSKVCINPNEFFIKFILLLDNNVLHANQIAKLYVKENYKKQRNSLKMSNINLKQSEIILSQKQISHSQNPNNLNKKSEICIQNQQISQFQDFVPSSGKLPEIYQPYCTLDGRIDMNKFFLNIEKNQVIDKYMSSNKLFRSGSMQKNEILIFEGIKVFLSRHILEKDKNLHSFYLFLKKLSLKSRLNFSNDWYQDYVGIFLNEGTEPKSIENLTLNQVIKSYQVKQDKVFQVFDIYFKSENIENKLLKLEIHQLNILKQVLIGDALGIVNQKKGFFQKCYGESLWLRKQKILRIQAYLQEVDSCILKIKKFFNCNFLPYGIKKNLYLPNWLQFELKRGFIIFKGTPTEQDIENFQVRVYDINRYTIMKFDIEVKKHLTLQEPNQPQHAMNATKQNPYNMQTDSNLISYDKALNFQSQSKQPCQKNNTSLPLNKYVDGLSFNENYLKSQQEQSTYQMKKKKDAEAEELDDVIEYTNYDQSPYSQNKNYLFQSRSQDLKFLNMSNLNI